MSDLSYHRLIAEALSHLPLQKGDTIWIAADLTRLAALHAEKKQRFQPAMFATHILDSIQPGTILIPGFVNTYVPGVVFDKQHTMPVTGALSKWALKSQLFKRNADPFHSFFIKGEKADLYASVLSESSFGKDSVFDVLYQERAKLLLWDVDFQYAFTFAHFVEEMMQVSYRHYKVYDIPVIQNGSSIQQQIKLYEKKPGYKLSLFPLKKMLSENGACIEGSYKNCSWSMVDLHQAYRLLSGDIQKHGGKNFVNFDSFQWCKDRIKSLFSL